MLSVAVMVLQPCPCGSPVPVFLSKVGRKRQAFTVLSFENCCGRYGVTTGAPTQPAPDAESLMRSRYSAFVLQDAGYLLATWHPTKRPLTIDFEPGLKWLGLEVCRHQLVDAFHAEVEFIARSKLGGQSASRLHERSRFVNEAGQWLYLDGDDLVKASV